MCTEGTCLLMLYDLRQTKTNVDTACVADRQKGLASTWVPTFDLVQAVFWSALNTLLSEGSTEVGEEVLSSPEDSCALEASGLLG